MKVKETKTVKEGNNERKRMKKENKRMIVK